MAGLSSIISLAGRAGKTTLNAAKGIASAGWNDLKESIRDNGARVAWDAVGGKNIPVLDRIFDHYNSKESNRSGRNRINSSTNETRNRADNDATRNSHSSEIERIQREREEVKRNAENSVKRDQTNPLVNLLQIIHSDLNDLKRILSDMGSRIQNPNSPNSDNLLENLQRARGSRSPRGPGGPRSAPAGGLKSALKFGGSVLVAANSLWDNKDEIAEKGAVSLETVMNRISDNASNLFDTEAPLLSFKRIGSAFGLAQNLIGDIPMMIGTNIGKPIKDAMGETGQNMMETLFTGFGLWGETTSEMAARLEAEDKARLEEFKKKHPDGSIKTNESPKQEKKYPVSEEDLTKYGINSLPENLRNSAIEKISYVPPEKRSEFLKTISIGQSTENKSSIEISNDKPQLSESNLDDSNKKREIESSKNSRVNQVEKILEKSENDFREIKYEKDSNKPKAVYLTDKNGTPIEFDGVEDPGGEPKLNNFEISSENQDVNRSSSENQDVKLSEAVRNSSQTYKLENLTSKMSTKSNAMSEEELAQWQTQSNAGIALGNTLREMRNSGDKDLAKIADKISLTSGNKGDHVQGSQHYKGNAFDFNRSALSEKEQEIFKQYAEKNGLKRDAKDSNGKIEPWHYTYRGKDLISPQSTQSKSFPEVSRVTEKNDAYSEKRNALFNNQKFMESVNDFSKSRGIDPNNVLKMMKYESKYDPTSVNSLGYKGLFQIGKSVFEDKSIGKKLKESGFDYENFEKQSPERQMEAYKIYYDEWQKRTGNSNKIDSAGDFAALQLAPGTLKNESGNMYERGSKGYLANSNLDINKDGSINKEEYGQKMNDRYGKDKEIADRLFSQMNSGVKQETPITMDSVLAKQDLVPPNTIDPVPSPTALSAEFNSERNFQPVNSTKMSEALEDKTAQVRNTNIAPIVINSPPPAQQTRQSSASGSGTPGVASPMITRNPDTSIGRVVTNLLGFSFS